ncbi:MAG: pyridoxamine 5'-phosphate oxidase [Phycisphaeraceae bacterium]|nr:pyridoxamine 5'-phosphate oxidase [Phycisphaeraceae bacterium]
MQPEDPYHEGEKAIQARVGVREIASRNGRAVNTQIMAGALKFIAQQPMAILGSMDEAGAVWASVLGGAPGFAVAPDPATVTFDLARAASHPRDPLWANLERQPQVGGLFIEPGSRRRLRVNGRLRHDGDDALRLEVAEAYPNCPQYIQRRHLRAATVDSPDPVGGPFSTGDSFGPDQRQWIESADTFFIASAHPTRGADVSHRGGPPGFVRVLDARTLRVPDYQGNSMFNTLGNLAVHPAAGLAFIDFESGRVLQLTGRAVIRWDLAEDDAQPTGGSARYWDFKVDRWIEAGMSRPLEAEFLDAWDRNPSPA